MVWNEGKILEFSKQLGLLSLLFLRGYHFQTSLLGMMFESGTLDGKGRMEDLVVKKIPDFFLHFTP